MSSFGDRLKRERESRDASIDDIADATKIHRRFLEALEQEDFDTLPGAAYGKFYIRAYAGVLGFDPEPLIADYDRACHLLGREDLPGAGEEAPPAGADESLQAQDEQEPPKTEETPVQAEPDPPPLEEPEPVRVETPAETPKTVLPEVVLADPAPEPASGRGPGRKPTNLVLACVAVVIVGVGIYSAVSRTETPPIEPTAIPEPVQAMPEEEAGGAAEVEEVAQEAVEPAVPKLLPPREPPPKTAQEPVDEVTAESLQPEPVPERPASPGRLTVTEAGIGTGIKNSRLEGRGKAIEEGGVAWFQTRVRGGRMGDTILHVWMHEGRTIQSIELKLGGSHWRTHSRKTLSQEGQWTVEARDRQGTVLASETVTCLRVRR